MVYFRTHSDQVSGETREISITAHGASAPKLWFRFDADLQPSPASIADATFPVGLLNAMMTDGVLEMEMPVSARLLNSAEQIQDIFITWYGGKLRRAEIKVPVRSDESSKGPREDRTAACFSGGVDSFFTLLRHQEAIDTLVYVHGFDVPLSKPEVYNETADHLKEIAAEAGKRLSLVATNVKAFYRAIPRTWGPITHGASIASIGMLLGDTHGRLLIPSSHTYSELYPWGSHPLLDPLWSTDLVDFVHDGAAHSRVDKLVHLAHEPAVQRSLRVCWQNTGKYNCGVCEKCYRTKITLHLSGVLDKFAVFNGETIVPAEVASIQITNESNLSYAIENMRYAKRVGDREVEKALATAVAEYRRRSPQTKKLNERIERLEKRNERLSLENNRLKGRKSLRAANAVGRLIKQRS